MCVEFLFDKTILKFINHEKSFFEYWDISIFYYTNQTHLKSYKRKSKWMWVIWPIWIMTISAIMMFKVNREEILTIWASTIDFFKISYLDSTRICQYFWFFLLLRCSGLLLFFWLVGGGGMLLVGFCKSCVISLLFSLGYYKFGPSYILVR